MPRQFDCCRHRIRKGNQGRPAGTPGSRDREPADGERGEEIHANDRIRTGAGATAVLSLNGIRSVMISPSMEYNLGDSARGFKTLLKRGYLWASTSMKPGATMSVATTSAVTGVRGTKFSVIQDAQGMDVFTCTGEVQVALKDGKSVTLASGMFGSVDAAGNMGVLEKGKPRL